MTNRQTDIQGIRHADKDFGRHTERQTGGVNDYQIQRHIATQTDRNREVCVAGGGGGG